MKRIPQVLFPFAFLGSIVGIVVYFLKKPTQYLDILYICAGIAIVHSILNVLFGEQNNLITEIITIVIAVGVAFFYNLDTKTMIALFICIGEIAFVIVFPLFTLIIGGLMIPLSANKKEQSVKEENEKLAEEERKKEVEAIEEKLQDSSLISACYIIATSLLDKSLDLNTISEQIQKLFRFGYQTYGQNGVEAVANLIQKSIKMEYDEDNHKTYRPDDYSNAGLFVVKEIRKFLRTVENSK